MIREHTFHINPDRQTKFEWVSLEEGIGVYPDRGYDFIIPWADFSRCLYQAQEMARGTNRVKLGNHMNTPSPGGLGEWMKANKNLFRSLTNRRLSQLGPILRRMGIIDYENEGNSIVWVFRKE